MPRGERIATTKKSTIVGSTFLLKFTGEGEEGDIAAFTVIAEEKSDPKMGKILSSSPVAQAISRAASSGEKVVGQKIEIKGPRGIVKIEILEIS